MSRSSAIAKSALFFALARKNGSGSGGENPYEYLVKNGYSNTEQNFINDWKASLSRKPFAEEFADYLTSIGYTSSIEQANTWLLKLINGEIPDTQLTFYDYVATLGIDPAIATKINIDSKVKQLIEGTLTMNEFYIMLQAQGYKPTQDEMKEKIYEVLTTVYATKEDLDEAMKNAMNPYEYAHNLDNSIDKDTFDKNYLAMANNRIIYNYFNDLQPGVTDEQVNKVMLDLINNKFYNKTLLQLFQTDIGYAGTQDNLEYWMNELLEGNLKPKDAMTPYEYLVNVLNITDVDEDQFNDQFIKMARGELEDENIYEYLLSHGLDPSVTQDTVDEWLLKLVNGEINGMTPYEYAISLGSTQTKEDFDYQFFTLLCKYLVDGGGADKYPGEWEINPSEPGNEFDIYEFYKSIGYTDSREDLYSALYTLANMLISGGSASGDKTDIGEDKFPGIWDIRGYQSVYQWFVSAGYNKSEEELKIQMNNIANLILSGTADGGDAGAQYPGGSEFPGDWETNLPIPPSSSDFYKYMVSIGYTESKATLDKQILNLCNQLISGYVDGGSAPDNSDFHIDDTYPGKWEIGGNVFTQKSLYELYCDISDPDNRLSEIDFNNKFDAYFHTQLPEITNGGDSENGLGKDEYEGKWDSGTITPIQSKNLYQLFTDIGMNPNNISKEEFDKKLVDLAENSKLPYAISGGASTTGVTDDDEIFEGEWSTSSLTSSGLYDMMVKNGYSRSIETLARQMNEIFTNPLDSESINPVVDGGSSSGQDADGEYNGPIREARNAVLQYLIDNGFDATPENIKAFNNRFIDFAEGELTNTLVDGGKS